METRGSWTDLIAGVGLEIAEVFNQGQEEYQPGIFAILKEMGGDGAQRNVTGKTGSGKLARFDDADDLPSRKRFKTYTTKVVYNDYGATIDVSKNTIEDREYQEDLDEMKDLSISANYSQDQSGVQLFNGGFATTIDVNGFRMTWYGDGQPLFSTVHATVVPGGSTQSNASSNSIAFSATNLETGLIAMKQQQTDDGLAVVQLGKPMLSVASQNEKEMQETTQSVLNPNTANNAINVYNNGMKTDGMTTVFLDANNGGSDTAWFLCIPQRHKLNHEVRQAPKLETAKNIKNKVVTFTIDARWADSATDWRRTWGSKGDGTTYSS